MLGQRTIIMGVINVTPDSFSGDGLGGDISGAVEQGRRLLAEGAQILDVGGESTRPGHEPVSTSEEAQRVVPVIERLIAELDALVSIDTRKSEVARAAVDAGAEIVNDVTGLRNDPEVALVAAEARAGLVLQHWHPRSSEDTVRWVSDDLRWSVDRALEAGVSRDDIVVDPGLGFGKAHEESMELIRRLGELKANLPYPVLIGPSRKRFIGAALGGAPVDQRLEGTFAAAIIGLVFGANIIRVHDVLAVSRAIRAADAILARARAQPGP
ncbi:MAG TPA: dihydropteroate synthase [Chloroflexota bacterium]|nr:dihydropteroate synthase [Chloroflexota bacterium]